MRFIPVALACVVLLLSAQVAAFSELIIDENFSVDYGKVVKGQDCGQMSQAYLIESVTVTAAQEEELKKVDELVWKSRQMLISARLAWERQHNFWLKLIPGMYDSLGYYCVQSGVQATRLGIGAARVVGKKIDEKLEEIDFEIGGENFQGTASRIAQEAREAYNETGQASAGMREANAAVREEVAAVAQGRDAASVAGLSAGKIIESKGAVYKLLQFYSNATKAIEELKEEENNLEEKVEVQSVEVREKIENLKKKGAGQLGLWEIEKISLYLQANGVTGMQIEGNSVAELVEDAENNLQKADAIKSAPKPQNRGRTARRIKSLRIAVQKVQLANQASERAEETLSTLLKQLQQRSVEERRKAQEAITNAEATRRKTAEAIISSSMPPAANKAQQAMQLAEEIKRSQQAIEIAQEEFATLKARSELKARVDSLAKKAALAEKDEIETNAVTIHASEISKTLDQPLKPEELLLLSKEVDELEGELAEKIEESYGFLREEVEKLQIAANANLLKTEEEIKLKELTRIFRENNLINGAGKLEAAEKEIDKLSIHAEQAAAALITANNLTDTEQFKWKANETIKINPQNNVKEIQQIFLTSEIEAALGEMQEKISTGISAFYSEKTNRKSLQQISFENSKRKAEKLARQIEKFKGKPLAMMEAEKLRNEITEINAETSAMQGNINEIESQATLEIALASQKALDNETTSQVQKAQMLMEEGKFTQALQAARAVNSKAIAAQPSTPLTGAATVPNYKEYAIAGSVAIILLGAAYLYLTKNNGSFT